MRYCPQCGARVSEEDAFCFECGADLDPSEPDQISSLKTAYGAGVLAVIGLFESLFFIFSPESILAQAEEFGLGDGLSAEMLMVTGGFGLFLSLVVGALCYYYYTLGYVDKRFFWTLIITGVLGFLFASMFSFLFVLGIGIYGLVFALD